MPRSPRHLQLSFAGGEMSPEMWARFDDPRVRSGAARLRNMITHPRGSAARRPGFELVREVKDSTKAVRLLPFRFSNDQTAVIEMGRATVDAREIGYFRFHTNGGTLLQQRPDDYKAAQTATAINTTTDAWTVGGSHGFETGDPIVITMEPDSLDTCTFDTATNEVVRTAHAFFGTSPVIFRTTGTLPAGLVPGRVYYMQQRTADRFRISNSRNGPVIEFADAGTGTHTVACLQNPLDSLGGVFFIDPNTTYYAIFVSSTEIKIAATRADALAGTALDVQAGETGSVTSNAIRIHYDYRNGSVAYDTVNASPFYCRKIPWGTPGSRQINLNDHLDHPTTALEYWVRQPGTSSTVTFDVGTDRVNWTAHGRSDGEPVIFTSTSTLPPEITSGVAYYIRNSTTNDFQVSASVAGPVLDLTGAGSGTITAFADGIYEVPHYFAEAVLFEVNVAQSNDVLTMVHPDRPAAELRRLGAAHWVLEDVLFNSALLPPTGVAATAFLGEGNRVDNVGASAGPAPSTLTTVGDHTLLAGEVVRAVSVPDISDGFYVVETTPTSNTLTLKEYDDGTPVFGTTGGSGSSDSVLYGGGFTEDLNETYVVTALDDESGESQASESFAVSNNLLNNGAYNTITWEAVAGATRYHVYKDVNGLFGFIGEVEAPTLSFVDDDIAPDLSITPPRLDTDLRQTAEVTFDTTDDFVQWANHGREAGAPVLFDTDKNLPTGLEYGKTYYVLNPGTDDFQLSETQTGTTVVAMTGAVPTGVHTAISGQFPAAVTYFEQRRVLAGGWLRPQDFRLTASGTENDLSYRIPVQESDRILNRLAARERSDIRHAVPVGNLLLLTRAAEYRVSPLDSDALTPGGVAARAPTHIGASLAAPVVVNNVVVFPADRGGHVRELGFFDRVGDYVTNDVSLRATHLFENRTIVQMAYQQAPHPIVWAVSSSGTLLGFSYVPEEQVAGWHEHDVDGSIESCAAVAEGLEDRLYVIANRGGTRYVERMGCQCVDAIEDLFYVDSGVTYSGAAATSVFVPHLAGQAVTFLADGIAGTGTVSAAGVLTLTTAASKVHVGLPYTSQLQTLPLGMQVDAALGSGRTKNINHVHLRVTDSGAFQVGPSLTALVASAAVPAGQLQTDLVQVLIAGDWGDDGQVYVQSANPLPLSVTGLTLEVAMGA